VGKKNTSIFSPYGKLTIFESKIQLLKKCMLSLFTDHALIIKSSNHANNINPVKI